MAALPTIDPRTAHDADIDAAAAQMAQLLEDYYDDIGLSEQEKDQRIAAAGEFIKTVSSASPAKSA